MPWVPLTAQNVIDRMSAREVDVYESVSRKEYDEDGEEPPAVPVDAPERMPSVIEQVVNRFRGKIRANPNVSAMGPAGTIPDFCVFSAAIIARTALIALPPTQEGMTDPRRDEYRAAEKELEGLASLHAGAYGEDPPVASSSPSFGGSPLLDF